MPHKNQEARKEYHRAYYLKKKEKWAKLGQSRRYDPVVRKAYLADLKRRYTEPVFKRRMKVLFWQRRYNVSEDQVERMLEEQDGQCAICKTELDDKFSIDHDHSCCSEKGMSCGKCVRGLLCRTCNSGIGLLQDSVDILENAIAYIVRGKEVCQKRQP